MLTRFGDCELDSTCHILRRSGTIVHLTPKAFALLELLIERRPGLVAKDEILEHLWPGIFVSEANIPNLISEIRDAIADRDEQPRYIRTVYRLGYSFCGQASVSTSAPIALPATTPYSIVVGGRKVPLLAGDNVLGRAEGCNILVASHTVSRQHARIRVDGDGASIEDLGSKNGTYLDGRKAIGAVRLAHDDEIRIGELTIRFRVADQTRRTKTYAGGGRSLPPGRRALAEDESLPEERPRAARRRPS